MGYTHYFTFKKPIKGQANQVEQAYQTAIIECQKIILTAKKDGLSLSGYSAHTKLGQYGGISVNGTQNNRHEQFELREHFNQNFDKDFGGFKFCKTAQKPYDLVVTACLSVLKYRLKENIIIASDGDLDDWIDGVELAQRVTKRKIFNPLEVEEKQVA